MTAAVAAVDLGATSGRVILGHVGHNELTLTPIARFPNGAVTTPTGLRWDVSALFEHILAGLTVAAAREPELVSIAVDSWAVDYGLLRSGTMIDEPFHYRDERTAGGVAAVDAIVGRRELYTANGLQFLPFNSLYQLTADRLDGRLDGVETALLIPDLIDYWLTGQRFAERTNASTTGLLRVSDREWDDELITRLGLPREIFPTLIDAGTPVGALLPDVANRIGATVPVSTVGSHDTASAVAGIPATDPDFAYISCGTWSLVGIELERPVLTEAGRAANFTNEGGVDGRVRYLRNVMGLWVLSESVRTWEAAGERIDLPELLRAAASVTEPVSVFDPDDPRFLSPGDMPARIASWLSEHGQRVPGSRAAMVRSILESLADAYARTIDAARELTGKTISVIHLVGGGSLNTLLCQLTADRTGLPVIAGPVEATAIGNVLIQARAQGLVSGDLETLRAIVARSAAQERYLPRA
ncbi:MAG: rhamnulokinase family protein [Lacisediminihabitans sp.]